MSRMLLNPRKKKHHSDCDDSHRQPKSKKILTIRPAGLSVEQLMLVDGYRQLPSVTHLAVRCYLLRGDIRLARFIANGLSRRAAIGQLDDKALDELG